MMAGVCACLAVLFVSLGLFGVVTFSVAHRTAEFGIRMALGAQKATIVQMVLAQGLRIAALGLPLGGLAAFAITRLIQSLLFQVRALDAATFVLSTILILFITAVASYLPARR